MIKGFELGLLQIGFNVFMVIFGLQDLNIKGKKGKLEIVQKRITQETFIHLKLSPISTSSLINLARRKKKINASTASSVIWHHLYQKDLLKNYSKLIFSGSFSKLRNCSSSFCIIYFFSFIIF